ALALLSAGCVDADGARGGVGAFEEQFDLIDEVHLLAGDDPIGRISDLAVWAERFVIADAHAANLKVLTQAGSLPTLIGRAGGGPGEFRWARYLAPSEDGRLLLVLDGTTMEVSVFDSVGSFVKRWSIESLGLGRPHIAEDGNSVLIAGSRTDVPGLSPYTSV